jgi:FAD/FMN-containing dehydrogenase
MKRRDVLSGAAAIAGVSLAHAGCVSPRAATTKARPGEPGWPSDAEWAALDEAVGGRLAPVAIPDLGSEEARKLVANPFWLGDQAGLTESSGWLDGWTSSPSAYVVRAASAADVAAAVRFAQARNIRLVVRGGGHSYLGGSNAPDSLLVWTRDMEAIELHDAFTPAGCATAPVPAVSVGAGCIWGRVYDAATTRGGRYVQGGGCTSVGVAGLVLGGGFGSFSKMFGLAAASLLEAEIVTADGEIRIVNSCREPDLFWALKGGGGGTFGVVTRLTLRTHDLPETFGAVRFTVRARSDGAFRRLLARFVAEYAAHLFNPHWGEQVRATPDNVLSCEMLFAGLSGAAAGEAWRGLRNFVDASPGDYETTAPFQVLAAPARRLWDKTFLEQIPGAIVADDRPGARPRDFWWAGDGDQAGAFWHGYHSAWLPASLLEGEGREKLVSAWFEASRIWDVAFHFNKGLAGADAATLARSRDTSMNPQVLDAFALAIIAGEGAPIFRGFPEPDRVRARENASRIAQSMAALKAAAPGAGNYLSECDYFNENWREASWGVHAARLERIKRRYDPQGVFTVHHGVGSEA